MTELQHGLLQWLAASLAFGLGWGFHGLLVRSRDVRERVLGLEAERLAQLERRGSARKTAARAATEARRPGLRGGEVSIAEAPRSPVTQER